MERKRQLTTQAKNRGLPISAKNRQLLTQARNSSFALSKGTGGYPIRQGTGSFKLKKKWGATHGGKEQTVTPLPLGQGSGSYSRGKETFTRPLRKGGYPLRLRTGNFSFKQETGVHSGK